MILASIIISVTKHVSSLMRCITNLYNVVGKQLNIEKSVFELLQEDFKRSLTYPC